MTPLQEDNVEHYTMSSAGIVHVCPNEPSDCTPLSLWIRQSMMFNILRNIPFYKYYLHRKAFTVWKENVRFQLFSKQCKKVSERYFLARKTSCLPILEIKKCLLDVQKVGLLHLELRTCDKDSFVDQQSAQCQKASQQFEESMRKVIAEVQGVMVEVNNLHGSIHQENNMNMTYSDGLNPEKTKSLVKIKQEKMERKLMRQRAKLEYSTLPDFIRFVDYLTVETLVQLTVGTANAFYEELIKPRKSGIFETTIRFTATGTVFSPTCAEIRDVLDRQLEMTINTVGNVNRVSYLNSKAAATGPNIQSIIRENRQFKTISEQIQQKVLYDFERAEEHALSYESVRPIYDFNDTWDLDAYRAIQHDMQSLKGMMERISNWNKELDKLRNKPIGILEVDSKRLKGELNPLREARLHEIKEYIKDIAR